MLNIQPPRKAVPNHQGEYLSCVGIFSTIQGEGPFSGERAIFIRLAHCNLQCPGCDTDYTENATEQSTTSIMNMIRLKHIGPRLVVITGGEPFRQNISKLVKALLASGYRVQIETNGTLPPSPNLPQNITIVCSPKTGRINKKLISRITHYKYVLNFNSVNKEDGLPILALEHPASPQVARPGTGAPVYIQPMDSEDTLQNKKNIQATVKSCMEHGYILQLQIHKLIGVE